MKLFLTCLGAVLCAGNVVFAGPLKDACVSKGQTVANCTCIEREAKVVASPPVIEYMAVQMRTGQPPINMMLNSGMDVGVFGDQIAALSERTNRICFGR